jgi:hypothetical protein
MRILEQTILIFSFLMFVCIANTPASGQDIRKLSLKSYVEKACAKDSVFQEILMDKLKLQYAHILALPPKDIFLSVMGEYGITLGGRQTPEISVSLDRLFPKKGSSLSLQLDRTVRNDEPLTELSLIYGVDIARNAFGKATQILDRITGIETRIARLQIVETPGPRAPLNRRRKSC